MSAAEFWDLKSDKDR